MPAAPAWHAIFRVGCGDAAESQHWNAHGAHRLRETFDSSRFEAGRFRTRREHGTKHGIVGALVLGGAHLVESVAGDSD